MLGGNEADGIGCTLNAADMQMDRALQALYDSDRHGGLGSSAPNVARWLGDIREYFPASVVQVMQRDAIERLDMTRMLMEPELLESLRARRASRRRSDRALGLDSGEDARHGAASRAQSRRRADGEARRSRRARR